VAPSFQSAFLSNKLASYATSWVAAAQLAKSEAIKRNVGTVRLCRSADGASCATSGTWQQGWIVFHDANNDGLVSTGETIIHVHEALSSDYHFTSSSYSIDFQPSGLVSSSTTLTLCRATPSPGNQERQIALTTTAKASVSITRTGTCT
jgi:type IV fimbrial biogenesis protein FimT